MNNVFSLPKVNKVNLLKIILGLTILAGISHVIGMVQIGDIMMILNANGYTIPPWAADSLTAIGGVYGVQHYLIGLLGVTIPAWLAGAVVAAGSAGL